MSQTHIYVCPNCGEEYEEDYPSSCSECGEDMPGCWDSECEDYPDEVRHVMDDD